MMQLKFGKNEKIPKISIRKHPYTFARVSAMRAKLIEKEDYHKMLKMTISEIIEFIGEFGYRKAIDELSVNYSGVDLIERAMFKHYTETILKLKRISKDEVGILINAYVRRWDFLNIKTILRGKYSKFKTDYINSLLVPVGNLDYDELTSLTRLENIEDILKQIKILDFDKIKPAFESFIKTNHLIELENALDSLFYNNLNELSLRIKKGGDIFKQFLETSLDVINIKLLLKLKRANMPKQEIKKLLFRGGTLFNERFIEKAASADFENLIEQLKKTIYKEAFDERTEESMIEIELELDKLLIKKSFVSWHRHPLSALAILGFMLAKEAEVKNITTIARAKQLGIGNDFIEKKLIIID